MSYFNNFCNSWLKVKKSNKIKKSIYEPYIFDLNTIKKNKKPYLKFLNDFYGLEFNEEQINYAIEQLDLNCMKKNYLKIQFELLMQI